MFKHMNKNVDIRSNKLLFKVVFIITVVMFTTQILYINRYINIKYEHISEFHNRFGSNGSMDFSEFDNELGTPDGRYIVPNIIHFIRFSNDSVSYSHMICYLAAYKNQKPDKIYFHYNDELTFSGKYWNILKETPGFLDIVEFHYMEMPTEIFGQKLSDTWRVYHASDVARIRVLMKYGGIFLDNDSYVVRSLNDFRRYEMTLNWDDLPEVLGTQVLLAHKDARFLRLWLESYRGAYNSTLWYYNAAKRPTHEVLSKRPELIHRVKFIFGVNIRFAEYLYVTNWPQWRVMYTFHLPYIRFDMFENRTDYPTLPKSFDEFNIKNFNNTFSEMALEVYDPLLIM